MTLVGKGCVNMVPMSLIWVALIIAFCVAEGATVGLVSIWFALGAVGALIAALAGGGIVIQVVLFAAISLIAMALIRPLAAKVFRTRHEPTNADRVIGQEAVVLVPIDEVNGTGQVKVDGKIWTARPVGSEVIPEGTRVVIRSIEGVKVRVEPVTEPQTAAP